jgi:hypothetical protein
MRLVAFASFRVYPGRLGHFVVNDHSPEVSLSADFHSALPQTLCLCAQNLVSRVAALRIIEMERTENGRIKKRKRIEAASSNTLYLVSYRFKLCLEILEDFVIGVPLAYSHTAFLLSNLISANLLLLRTVGRLLKQGGNEEGELVELGGALKVLLGVLKNIKQESGKERMAESFKASGLELKNFVALERDRRGWIGC